MLQRDHPYDITLILHIFGPPFHCPKSLNLSSRFLTTPSPPHLGIAPNLTSQAGKRLSTPISNLQTGICFSHPSSYAFHPPPRSRGRCRHGRALVRASPHAAPPRPQSASCLSFTLSTASGVPPSSFPPPKAVVNGEPRKTEVFLEAGVAGTPIGSALTHQPSFCRKVPFGNDHHFPRHR